MSDLLHSQNGRWWRTELSSAAVLLLAACASAPPAPPPVIEVPPVVQVPRDSLPRVSAITEPEEPAPIPAGRAEPRTAYPAGFDAVHYEVALELPDTGRDIRARAIVHVRLREPRSDTLVLDLTGLRVLGVGVNGVRTDFAYADGKLRVPVERALPTGDTAHVQVLYGGVPDDGLIMRANVHGVPAVFADNWPNRARFWFPAIDHPSDKATFAIAVSAPAALRVISNGERLYGNSPSMMMPDPKRDYRGPRVLWRWGTRIPIPVYTMIVGAAQLSVAPVPGSCSGCPEITSWAFPQDSAKWAKQVARSHDMVRYFASLIAPFPYEKLAHIESSTRFGGMENASAIFYDEKAITAGQDMEETVAHETAHQWFGDSVTETEWHDLWLSEGFATYFAALFFEKFDGVEKFRSMMRDARTTYLKSNDSARPVVDSTQQDLFALLNSNSYQKGAWVLHMLRGALGDSAFFAGLRDYYAAHHNGNATTADLRASLEKAGGTDLSAFFAQWLFRPGHPRVRVTSRHDAARRVQEIVIEQVQPDRWGVFRLPVDVRVSFNRRSMTRTVQLEDRRVVLQVPSATPATRVEIDPDVKALVEVVEP